MLFIRRLSVCYWKNNRFSQRFQSNGRPTTPLGSRFLLDPDKVFDHNMWDHIQWSQEDEERAEEKAIENSLVRIQPELQDKYEREASKHWNEFYKTHQNNFFKDRNWLFLEFPEILPEEEREHCMKIDTRLCEDDHLCENNPAVKTSSVHNFGSCSDYSAVNLQSVKQSGKAFPGSDAAYRILEVGCGAGNSVFPVLRALCNIPRVFLYCCDFASKAVELVKSHPFFDPSRCLAFVHDVCDDASPYPFPDESLDVILLIFVLASVHPDRNFLPLASPLAATIPGDRNTLPNLLTLRLRTQGIINRLARLLKPGGMILFRDHGRYDATQLRFKKGSCLSENFYMRRDGTRVYFFTKDEVHNLFSSAGLIEVQNEMVRRLQVNRKKKVKIHRVWIQSKFQKPLWLTQSKQEYALHNHSS